MEGLQGRSVVDICTEYGISQSQYYKWRDIFLAHIEQPFETGAKSKKEQKLEQENMRLRKVIGDLTVELKKTTGKTAPKIIGSRRISKPFFTGFHQGIEVIAPFLGLQANLGDITP